MGLWRSGRYLKKTDKAPYSMKNRGKSRKSWKSGKENGGHGTRDAGHGTRDTGHGTREAGHGTRDAGSLEGKFNSVLSII